MSTVTFTLVDFKLGNLASFAPQVTFAPQRVAGFEKFLLAPKTIVVTPLNANGDSTVELTPSNATRPEVKYDVSITWLDPAAGYPQTVYIAQGLYVPLEGGSLPDLIEFPSNPAQTHFSPYPPDEFSPGALTQGTWALNTSTGDLYEWTN